jgi:hypothetical protein
LSQIIFYFFIFLSLISYLSFITAFASSPAYVRQVLVDDPDLNVGDIDVNEHLRKLTNLNSLPLDIIAATYVSDGITLNGTIWLLNPIYQENHSTYVNDNLTYRMDISPFMESSDPIEDVYSIIISPDLNGTWTKTIIEHEPIAEPLYSKSLYSEPLPPYSNKTIEEFHNYTGFPKNGNR